MNRIIIIGNLTRDPETQTTPNGKTVCHMTVAANRKNKLEGHPEADYFRVNAWNKLGESCQKYLTKGRKVAVVGSVSLHVYTNQNNEPSGTIEVYAEDVEFLSPRPQDGQSEPQTQSQPTEVPAPDELPF